MNKRTRLKKTAISRAEYAKQLRIRNKTHTAPSSTTIRYPNVTIPTKPIKGSSKVGN